MPSPIKILHIVFSLDPGGMENGVVNVANHLPTEEFQVDVCCLERRGAFADRLPKNSRVAVLNKQPGKSISTIWKLHRLIRKWKPDIIHPHNLGPLIYASWATLGGRLCPILQGEHGQFPEDEMTGERLAQRKKYYGSCQFVHTVSGALREQVLGLDIVKPDQIASIRNGVDTKRFQPQDKVECRQQLGLPEEGMVMGSVGRMTSSKRYSELLDAFDRFSPPECSLLLVGDGDCLNDLKRTRDALSSKERIYLLGHCDRPELAYTAMDLFVLPSSIEGLSNVILEAMACELPCLVNDSCGSSEVINDRQNGFLRKMHTVEEITTELKTAHDERASWKKIGMNARKTVQESFSMESMASHYAALYRQILETGN